MKRKLGAVLFVIYSIIAIIVTVLLLSFNDYRCSEIGEYTVYIANNDALEPDYEKGSILVIESTSDKHINVGDKAFFYRVLNSKEYDFVHAEIAGKVQQGRHIIYSTTEGENYSAEYFVGKADDTSVIPSPFGTILSILESKWGYLFCIVIVSLLLFLQEVFDLIIEIRYGGTKGTKAANIANARKAAEKNAKAAKKAPAKAGAKTAAASATAAKPKTTATKTAATVAKKVATAATVNNTQTGVEEEG